MLGSLRLLHLGDITDPRDFEEHCCVLLRAAGFNNVRLTSYSQDYGIDILADDGTFTYAIQCKFYSHSVGIQAIQEVVAGKFYYKCDKTAVMTNSGFTNQAEELAVATQTLLWDYHQLIRWEYQLIKALHSVDAPFTELSEDDIDKLIEKEQDKEAEEYYGRALLAAFNAGYVSESLLVEGCSVRPSVAKAIIVKMEMQKFIKKGSSAIYSINEEKIEGHLNIINSESSQQTEKETQLQENEEESSEWDEMLPRAIEVVVEAGYASTSLIQRRLRLGYAHAGRVIDQLEQKGIVGPHEGSKPRQVLITRQQMLQIDLSGEFSITDEQSCSDYEEVAVQQPTPKSPWYKRLFK